MTHSHPGPADDQRVVAVLGAGQGIGAAIAARSVATGRRVVLVARTAANLDVVRSEIDAAGTRTVTCPCDITSAGAADTIATRSIEAFGEAPSIVVHSAGSFRIGGLATTTDEQVTGLFIDNALGPLRVIRSLLERSDDQGRHVVVINSSAGLALNQTAAAYSASQVAMRALTDALRASVNPLGVRVTSVFTGRTDTPRIRTILASEGMPYDPSVLLRPDDVAGAVLATIDVSEHAEITEISIRPMRT